MWTKGLDHDLVDGPFDCLKLTLEFTVLGGGDTRSDDGSGDIASPSQGSLGFYKDVWNILLNTSDSQNQIISGFLKIVTFSSQSKGRCKRISRGSVSAVRIMSSAIPRFRVFVARENAMKMCPGGVEGHDYLRWHPF